MLGLQYFKAHSYFRNCRMIDLMYRKWVVSSVVSAALFLGILSQVVYIFSARGVTSG